MKILKHKLIFAFCCFQLVLLQAQDVNIPDVNFKNALLNHNPVIDTNGDGEIQVAEANIYNSFIDYQGVTLPENLKINDLTGIEAFPNITGLNVRFNNVSGSIDVSNSPLIIGLDLRGNQITSLIIGSNSALEQLNCAENMITSIDVSQIPSLKGLRVQNNNITTLDVSQNPDLSLLFIADNQISSIDVSNNPLMKWLYCQNNDITSFDLTNNINLDGFLAQNNDGLSEIDIRNGANSDIIDFNVTDNASLNCIYVDDSSASYLTFPWSKDATATYVENEMECSALSIEDFAFNRPNIFPNPVSNILNIDSRIPLELINIYDINGRIISPLIAFENSNQNSVNLSELVSGIYFIEINTKYAQYTYKLIKE